MDAREDGKNNTLSAGKSAACDENEVWDCMYHLIDSGVSYRKSVCKP